MSRDRTRLTVRKTIEQLRGELTSDEQLKALAIFEARLDFNLDLARVPKIGGRKPKSKPATPATK